MRLHVHGCVAALALLSIPAFAAPDLSWRLVRSQHFEIYAQASDQSARAILQHFEQLRAFFQQQSEWKVAPSPVRVIVFASPAEYQPYRLRATADAYYVGSDEQNYIVMAGADPQGLAAAAHEYTHLILRATPLELPPGLRKAWRNGIPRSKWMIAVPNWADHCQRVFKLCAARLGCRWRT